MFPKRLFQRRGARGSSLFARPTYRASAAPTTLKSRHQVTLRPAAALASEASTWAASHHVRAGANCKRLLGGATDAALPAVAPHSVSSTSLLLRTVAATIVRATVVPAGAAIVTVTKVTRLTREMGANVWAALIPVRITEIGDNVAMVGPVVIQDARPEQHR